MSTPLTADERAHLVLVRASNELNHLGHPSPHTGAALLAPYLIVTDDGRVCVPDMGGNPRMIPNPSGDGTMIDHPLTRAIEEEAVYTIPELRWKPLPMNPIAVPASFLGYGHGRA